MKPFDLIGLLLLPLWALAGCAGPRTDPSPTIDLDRFPHVLDLTPLSAADPARVETRLINFGTAEGRLFQSLNWSDDGVFEKDGSTFSWSLGPGSTVRFTSFERRKLTLTARLRPYRIDGPAQKVEIELNGQPVVVLELKGGMRTYRFDLPAEAMILGRNELSLENLYPRNIGPGPPDLGPPGAAWDYLRFDSGREIAGAEVDSDEIRLPFGAEIRFFAELTGPSILSLERLESSHRRGRLDIRLRIDGGTELTHLMRASARAQHWDLGEVLDAETSLAESNRAVLVELSLRAIGGPRARDDQAIRLHKPRLRSSAEAFSIHRRSSAAGANSAATAAEPTGSLQAEESHADKRPNVLVYLVDTLRADHLGCYGYERETSPQIDAFAADAILFDNAYANSSWTRSTIASLFTGRLPPSHGVHGRKDALAEEAATLAEVLRQGGYRTAAFVTNGNAGQQVGLGQGFDTFRLLIPPKGRKRSRHVLSDSVHRQAVQWLDQPRERPFFLYLHTIDPHTPYAPPQAAASKLAATLHNSTLEAGIEAELADFRRRVEEFSPEPVKPGSLTWLHGLQRGLIEVSDHIISDLVSLYDAEILFNDFYFGRLIHHLKKTGLYDNTILVFVSDHGEEFHEHQSWEHGRTLYQEQIRVPLIVRFPKGPRGLRIRAPAQQIDLLPTLTDVLKLPLPSGVQGESLWPYVSSDQASEDARQPRAIYAQLELDGYSAESLIRGRYKLVCARAWSDGCRLFDLTIDPGETVDLAAQRPVLSGYMQQWLRTFAPTGQDLKASQAEEGAEVRDHLRALGYL